MRHKIIVLIFGLFVILGGAKMADANICFSCHDKTNFTSGVIHAPVQTEKCSVCHNPHVARFEGLLHKQDANLCAQCHDTDAYQQGNVHQPIRQGQCLVCHAPHNSQSKKGLLRSKDVADNCFTCHDKQERKYTHKPFGNGECNVCHQPHQSEYRQLLRNESDKLCGSCHNQCKVKAKYADFSGKIKNCISCHNPHGSDNKSLVRDVMHEPFKKGCNDCHGKESLDMDTCLKCHETITKHLNTTHSHITQIDRNGCIICHAPHAGDTKSLLKGKIESICRDCHTGTFEKYEESIHRHKDFAACTNCHDVHGSNQWAMLKGDGNKACVSCHETQGQFTHPVGDTIRDPRTKQIVSCVSCHYSHGTHFKFELKYNGSRELCIQCHRSY